MYGTNGIPSTAHSTILPPKRTSEPAIQPVSKQSRAFNADIGMVPVNSRCVAPLLLGGCGPALWGPLSLFSRAPKSNLQLGNRDNVMANNSAADHKAQKEGGATGRGGLPLCCGGALGERRDGRGGSSGPGAAERQRAPPASARPPFLPLPTRAIVMPRAADGPLSFPVAAHPSPAAEWPLSRPLAPRGPCPSPRDFTWQCHCGRLFGS